jgi:hypothetical protein
MSDTTLDYRRPIPDITRPSLAASPLLIRWSLRIVTVLLFGAATAFGVSLGMGAPEASPTSVVQQNIAPTDR